jgi:hypothetical protein
MDVMRKDASSHQKRMLIDAAFAGMSSDDDYQKEAFLVSLEFRESDWEASLQGEDDLKKASNVPSPRNSG